MTNSILRDDLMAVVGRLGDAADAFSGKTIMIVGASGFLGQQFVQLFETLGRDVLDEPCRIIAADSLITGAVAHSDSAHLRFLEHDIREPFQSDEEIHFLVHAAGVASPVYYRRFPVETIEVATLGTRNVLQLAQRNGARALYFSSSEIYGDPDAANIPTPESYRGNVACLGPRACYDESKRMGETMCYVHARYFETQVSIVRPFNVYGPGMRDNDYRVLPNFAKAILTNSPLTLYASGQQTRTYCYSVDAMTGFMLALLRGRAGEAYNIGASGPEVSVIQLADLLESVHGSTLQRTYIDYPDTYPADEPQRRCPELEKARRELGYRPQVALEDGLARYLTWAADAYTA
ncbi:MAG: NAD-dependent epimerase/dehydratase family protein [Pseudomonadota bacterium]